MKAHRLGKDSPTNRPLRLGIIGCGFQGELHVTVAASSHDVELVACCDVDEYRATRLRESGGARYATDDWESLVSDPEIDAVVVATPTDSHAEIAIAAANAGKHVLLEKPMATSVADCLAIERAANTAGIVLMIGFKFRFAPAVVAAREAVPEPIVLTAQTLYDAGQPTAGWLNDRLTSGGRLMSTLVHSVDVLRFLARSDPVRVTAVGGTLAIRELAEPDNMIATVEFASGSIASIVHGTAGHSSLLSTWSFQTAGIGRNATVYDHGRRMALNDSDGDHPVVVDPVDDPFATGMRQMTNAFYESVRSGRAISAEPRDGTLSVLISRHLEEAIDSGTTQEMRLPLTNV